MKENVSNGVCVSVFQCPAETKFSSSSVKCRLNQPVTRKTYPIRSRLRKSHIVSINLFYTIRPVSTMIMMYRMQSRRYDCRLLFLYLSVRIYLCNKVDLFYRTVSPVLRSHFHTKTNRVAGAGPGKMDNFSG